MAGVGIEGAGPREEVAFKLDQRDEGTRRGSEQDRGTGILLGELH